MNVIEGARAMYEATRGAENDCSWEALEPEDQALVVKAFVVASNYTIRHTAAELCGTLRDDLRPSNEAANEWSEPSDEELRDIYWTGCGNGTPSDSPAGATHSQADFDAGRRALYEAGAKAERERARRS